MKTTHNRVKCLSKSMCMHRHTDLWEYEWICAISASLTVHLLRLQNLTLLTGIEWDHPPGAVLRKHSSGVKLSFTYSGKTLPLFFYRSPCFACCLEARSLYFTRGSVAPGSLCPPWERVCLFMGRMLCPCDPWVNPGVIMRSKSWHQSGEESCLFSQHVWSGWDDWRQTSHLLGSHTMREKSKCNDVTLCAWFQLSALLACKAGKDSRCVLLLYYQWAHSHTHIFLNS